jgi:ABC-type lipoprotein release transport system permease subunit
MKSRLAEAFHFLLVDIRYDWVRTLLTTIGMAAIIFTYFVLGAFSNTLDTFNQSAAVGRNLIIVQSDLVDATEASMEPSILEAVQTLSKDSVSLISPVIYRHMRVEEHVVLLRATRVEDWQAVFHLALLEGNWPKDTNEVVIGEGAAAAYDWKVNSELTIYGSQFRVSGIARSPGTAFSSVWMPLETGQSLYGMRRGYQALYVQTAPGADAEAVLLKLQGLPVIKQGYSVFFEDTYTRRDNQLMRDLSKLMRMVSVLTLLAVTLGTYTATSLSLVERSREVGILRAVGFSHKTVGSLLGMRAMLQGWIAFLAGLLFAAGFIAYRQYAAKLFVLGFYIGFEINWPLVVTGLILTSVLAAIGALLSVHKMLSSSTDALLRGIS